MNSTGICRVILVVLLKVIFLSDILTAQVSPKRGYGYGYNSPEDMQAMSAGSSWWYNWAAFPDAGVASTYSSSGVEFVPMFWGGVPDYNTLMSQIPADAKFLLGYNEPNFYAESNITPTVAAQRWPVLEQVANDKGLKLVSPAVNYCGGGCNEPDPVKWLDSFFVHCPGCKVDFIAIHWYECTGGGLTWFLSQFKKYNRPLWVTEFACGQGNPTTTTQRDYMEEAVDIMENDPDVFRYAWFAGRTTAIQNANLLGSSGVLTTVGNKYKNLPFPAPLAIPGKIESEKYYVKSGVDTENCTDAGGGQNVGWTDTGDWMNYNVQIAVDGIYDFTFRLASLNGGGSFHLLLDDQLIPGNVGVAATGGWQSWTTVTKNNVTLSAGNHTLTVVIDAGNFNMNYFNTVLVTDLTPVLDIKPDQPVKLYPNPFHTIFLLDLTNIAGVENIEISQPSGKISARYEGSQLTSGRMELGEALEQGVYFVKVTASSGVKIIKVVKQ